MAEIVSSSPTEATPTPFTVTTAPLGLFLRDIAPPLVSAARHLRTLLTDPTTRDVQCREIKGIEATADALARQAVARLFARGAPPADPDEAREDAAFLAPLTAEQERAQLVIRALDDIVDYIDAIARRLHLHGIERLSHEAVAMADLGTRSVEALGRAALALASIAGSERHRRTVVDAVSEIERLHDEATLLKRQATARLFKEITDVRQLLKTKEILELTERVIERCEQAGRLLPGFLLH